MEDFIEMNESVLGEHVGLSVGCPSNDTLERVVSIVNPDFLKEIKELSMRILTFNLVMPKYYLS